MPELQHNTLYSAH